MNQQAALQILLAAGMSLMGGAPVPLVLLQLVGNLSRQITPDDVREAVKVLEKAGSFAEAKLLEGLHAFAHGKESPWGPADTGNNAPAVFGPGPPAMTRPEPDAGADLGGNVPAKGGPPVSTPDQKVDTEPGA